MEGHPDSENGEGANGFPSVDMKKMSGISEPFRNNSVLQIFSCSTKSEILSLGHYGMYIEWNKKVN